MNISIVQPESPKKSVFSDSKIARLETEFSTTEPTDQKSTDKESKSSRYEYVESPSTTEEAAINEGGNLQSP